MNSLRPIIKVRDRRGRAVLVAVKQVLFFEGWSNYSRIHLNNENRFISSYTLKEQHETHPSFWRISRSYLVNPEHIARLSLNDQHNSWVELVNDIRLPISRRRVKLIAMLSKEFEPTAA